MTDKYCAKCGKQLVYPMDWYECEGLSFCGKECLPLGPKIIGHVPAFCTGAPIKVCKWNGVEDFLKANPLENGKRWVYDLHRGRGYIYVYLMSESEPNEDGVVEHWWVHYTSEDKEVIRDLVNSDMSEWDEEHANEHSRWVHAKDQFANCSESPWFRKWAINWLEQSNNIPRRCCANCKHCDVWDQGYDMPYIKCGNPEKMDDWGEDHDLPRGVVVCEKWESIEKWEEEE